MMRLYVAVVKSHQVALTKEARSSADNLKNAFFSLRLAWFERQRHST